MKKARRSGGTAGRGRLRLVEDEFNACLLYTSTAQSIPGQEAEKQLQAQFGKERTQLESQAAALNKKAEDLNKQAAALSEKARAEKAQEIQTQALDLDAKSGAYAQRLNTVQQALTAQMQDILATACANYGKQNRCV